MAGLLDGLGGLSGDNTVKDEFGQTQADRRDPIWSGLIKAGLLAVAGGSNVMPETRAKYLAEAGGAIGDIPSNMIAQAGASAQQKLRGQQLDEGKRKVADRDRVRALSQTPEFQEAIKGAKGGDKIAIQAAIDTGDIAALNAAISNLDKTAIGFAKNETALAKIEAARAKAENAGPMKGTGERNQLYNWLITMPPDSQEYSIAHGYFSQDQQVNQNGVVTTVPKMDLERYAKPTWSGTAPTAPPPPIPPPPAGQTVTDPATGITVETSADGKTVTETDPKTGVQTVREEGKAPRKVTPKAPDQAEVAKFHSAEVEGKAIMEGLENFRTISKNAKPEDRIKSVLGFSTALNTSYGISTMLAKGEALFNLGVLNGQDLEVIRRILPDPSTFKGSMSDAEQAVDQVIKIIQSRLSTREKQIYPRGRPGATPDKKTPTFNPATGQIED